jgi:two-component sensor histidine kinase
VVGNIVQGQTGLGTAFRVPVMRDGTVRYALTAPARPALFSDALRAQNLPPGWRALVADARNTIVGDSGDTAAVGQPLPPNYATALTAALSRMMAVRAVDGTDHHLAAAPAGVPGWHVLVLAPAGSAGGASRAIQYAVWAAIAAGAVLAVVLVGALLTASISRRNVVSLARANARLRDSQQRQKLLAREIDHRAKNLLALVQTILRLTRAGTVGDYSHAAQGRIAALARAHTLLSQARWEGADLGGLVAEELTPLRGAGASRVATHGPAVPLNAQAAQSLAMTLHELTTNAVKYGALSVPAGHVDLRWAWRGDALELVWEERGGPAVRPPEGRGVGMTVMERCVVQQLEGTIHFDWDNAGLRCTMTVPRGSLRRE